MAVQLRKFLMAATVCGVFVTAAMAQDPPTRVGRVSYTFGNVSMQPAGLDDWSVAVVNRPLTTGDNLWSDAGSTAEVHLNNAAFRLGSETSAGFMNLDDHFAQIRFTQGEMLLTVRRLRDDDSFEVDTPNAAVTILREGEYRFNADPNAATSFVAVRHGEAEVTGGGQAFTLREGNSAQLSGTDQLAYDVAYLPDVDRLENWAEDRDAREARSATARYLPPDVIGYEDLDAYGGWRSDASYGNVWYPRVGADWAPYHDGHWAFIEPWGWTWVDDAPWGFGASLSIGGPAVGWVALGPGDVYTPAFAVSRNYFSSINVSNTRIVNSVNITNVYNNVYVNKSVNVTNVNYVNMRAPNAVSAMAQNSFASGRPVRTAGVSIRGAELAKVQSAPVAVAPPVAPVRQAVAPMAGTKPAAAPPARTVSLPVVAKKTPPPAPVPFAATQSALQKNAGRPVNLQAIRQSAPARPAPAAPVRVAPPARQVTPPPAKHAPAPVGRPQQSAPPAPAGRPSQPAPAPAPTPAPRPAQPAPTPRPAQPAPAPRPAQPAPTPRPAQPAPAPRPAQPAPRPPEAAPRPAQPAPRPPEAAPRPAQPAPRPPEAAPRPAPRPPEAAPRPAQPAPRPPEAAPRPAPRPPEATRPPQKPPQKPKPDSEKEKEKKQ